MEEPVENIHNITTGPSFSWQRQGPSGNSNLPWEGQASGPGFAPPSMPGPSSSNGYQPASQGLQFPLPVQKPAACQICAQEKADKMLRDCGHFVCESCMLPWLRRRKVCPSPLCKQYCDESHLLTPKYAR
ncbi:uncharacterized protein LOC117648197 [Thrips palmi]|uniref:Uncharacterized protein LOC117648197 n=1 Tax=Thrips palmi TaxID=161013 RepID=A0A6P8Z1Q9_THRPL|nr:uncharacterized protein LOC117648197 [Thrips palmi]